MQGLRGAHRAVGWMAVAAAALGGCAALHPTSGARTAELQRLYQRSIEDAAVRHPDWNLPLWSFGDAGTALVSTFTDDSALDTASQVNWVAATAEVSRRCRGQPNTVLFLEQLLGLPPIGPGPGKRWHVYTFEISQRDMFRPCPGGVDSAVASAPRCLATSTVDPHLDDATAQFLLQQFWFSHRAPTLTGGVPDVGFPWTGMGWTYDWNPRSRHHVGVSEFVVRKGAVPLNPRDVTPAEFCAALPQAASR